MLTTPESQFAHSSYRKPRKSRKMRKNYTTILLPDRMAKGKYKKGSGFNKTTRIKGRQPIMGDKMFHDERAVWLRAS